MLMLSIFLLITSIDSQFSFSNLWQISKTLESTEWFTFEADVDLVQDSISDAYWPVSCVMCHV